MNHVISFIYIHLYCAKTVVKYVYAEQRTNWTELIHLLHVMKSLGVPLESHFSAWTKMEEKFPQISRSNHPTHFVRLTEETDLSWPGLTHLANSFIPIFHDGTLISSPKDGLPRNRRPRQTTNIIPICPNSQFQRSQRCLMSEWSSLGDECFSYDTDRAAKLHFINCMSLQLCWYL